MKRVLMILWILTMGSIKLSAQTKTAATTMAAVMANGKRVYNQYCLTCHMADGGGVPNMNPPLGKASHVLGDKTKLIHIILNGLSDSAEIDGETYTNVMAQHNFLSDQEIADVLTYIRNNFGNKASAVTAAQAKAVRAQKK